MSDFEYKPFDTLLSKIVDNRGKTCPTTEFGTPLIATNCISNEYLYPLHLKVRYVDNETFSNWFRGHPEPDDMIFVTKGTPGRVVWVPNPVGFCIAQDMVAIRADKDKIFPKYLFAALRSKKIQQEIEGLHVGTLIPHFKKGDFNDLLIPVPSKEMQKYIGNLYFDISLKIDLLHRQNKTLEAMGETLFRQWFVVEADEGWEDGKLGELVTITRGASPRPIVQYVKNGTVPWIKIADATGSNSFYINSTKEFIIEEGVSKSVQVFPGDLILSNSATCGLPFFVKLEGCIHDGWLLFRDFSVLSEFFVFFFLKQINRELNNVADGSVQNNLNTGILKEYKLKVPDEDTLKKFDQSVKQIINKMKSNINQICTLKKLRDTLLPKLMSGEIQIEEFNN